MIKRRKFIQETRLEDRDWSWDRYLMVEQVFNLLPGTMKCSSVLLVDTTGQVSARNLADAISRLEEGGGTPLRLFLRTSRLRGSIATLEVLMTKNGVIGRVRVASCSEVEAYGLVTAVSERLSNSPSSRTVGLRRSDTSVSRAGRTIKQIVENAWFVAATAALGSGLLLYALHK